MGYNGVIGVELQVLLELLMLNGTYINGMFRVHLVELFI